MQQLVSEKRATQLNTPTNDPVGEMVEAAKRYYEQAEGRPLTAKEQILFARTMVYVRENPEKVKDAVELLHFVGEQLETDPELFFAFGHPVVEAGHPSSGLIDSYGDPANAGRGTILSELNFHGRPQEAADSDELAVFFGKRDPVVCALTQETPISVQRSPFTLDYLENANIRRRAKRR